MNGIGHLQQEFTNIEDDVKGGDNIGSQSNVTWELVGQESKLHIWICVRVIV